MKHKFKKIILSYGIWFILGALSLGIVYAAFSDKSAILGSSFSVGNADIKLLTDASLGPDSGNLTDELPGPSFTNIGQMWEKDYPIKIFNNGTYHMSLVSHANYETANDPDDLRSIIYIEIFDWNDMNQNGQADTEEIGQSYGKKTIIKWKTEGINIGDFGPGQIKALVLRFSTSTVSDTKQGKTGQFDFEFDSLEM